jgi:hypothetical protein
MHTPVLNSHPWNVSSRPCLSVCACYFRFEYDFIPFGGSDVTYTHTYTHALKLWMDKGQDELDIAK